MRRSPNQPNSARRSSAHSPANRTEVVAPRLLPLVSGFLSSGVHGRCEVAEEFDPGVLCMESAARDDEPCVAYFAG